MLPDCETTQRTEPPCGFAVMWEQLIAPFIAQHAEVLGLPEGVSGQTYPGAGHPGQPYPGACMRIRGGVYEDEGGVYEDDKGVLWSCMLMETMNNE